VDQLAYLETTTTGEEQLLLRQIQNPTTQDFFVTNNNKFVKGQKVLSYGSPLKDSYGFLSLGLFMEEESCPICLFEDFMCVFVSFGVFFF
jgi:hypothetical protein